ncbi:type III restriction-modification system endonuclease [Empedobacter falsenii]|uniref:Type III restriction-modification system endonuclease n=1 Tax=Empedobacter falsenii TaxID=343874 RepID=A0A3R8Z7P5_9FLAO|nr:type III restriction-modification system endonuclease [Empedobacter falsenii]RRT90075.1 type III restriction-modification system endonuclease [Empedobacter falsenii]RRT90148.1 type III restriction-modification system endonuclease [Empedobacter falsenii]
MKGFNFEKNLDHQAQAVESTMRVFEHVNKVLPDGTDKQCINPLLDYKDFQYWRNVKELEKNNALAGVEHDKRTNIIDIMMETGTGKTYTYTKTMFELNKHYGIFKFIVVVPTLSIKAGTINFLKSDSSREHFYEQYGKTLKLHVVESQTNKKSKKSYIPSAVNSFVQAGDFDKNSIQVLIINAGMINSKTMADKFDVGLFDKHNVPLDAIAATRPFMIIDEPHKFSQDNTTWKNLQRMQPQIILRYGATFTQTENLVYTLSAVDAFSKNLVKGVIGHITEFEEGKNTLVKFIDTDGKEASFEVNEGTTKKTIKISKGDSLSRVHPQMTDLFLEQMNKSKIVLSNGLELKKGDKINPYSYAQTLQELMIQKAIKKHFEIEKDLLTREVRIKPLTLFFIDNIDEYRNKEGHLRLLVEQYIKAEVESLLQTETNVTYKAFLEKTLADIDATHGGYFSKDNSDKDEAIEKEINEILHDKEAILDLDNPRRFIFSKWTLREGWDNPNVFQICKLRNSGSEISKLQEVGRGLRLPVNEYGNRVKDEQFYLNYFVDFTESDFVDKLVNEINEKSGAISIEALPEKLTEEIIQKITEAYSISEDVLLEVLDDNDVIKRNNTFKDGGWDYIKQNYPNIFQGVNSSKIRKATDAPKKISVRTEKYTQLKALWEKLNEKVVLEYKFDDEAQFTTLLKDFFTDLKSKFNVEGLQNRTKKIIIQDYEALLDEEVSIFDDEITPVSTMLYSDFIKELAKVLNINLKTIHQAFVDADIEIDQYLNASTIRIIKQGFNEFLMHNAIDKFSIGYQKVNNSIHPTKLTDAQGDPLEEINAGDIGVQFSEDKVADNYYFEELFYDSELEKKNITERIKEVIVFTKIPKNSIKIPVAGGASYSPDFAYVLDFKDGEKQLHFIVETKDVSSDNKLREEEKQKIKHAEILFDGAVKVSFKTQFSNIKITELIKEVYQ